MDELGREDKLEYLQVVILLYYKYWISKKVTGWAKGAGLVPSFQIFQFLTYEGVNPTPLSPFCHPFCHHFCHPFCHPFYHPFYIILLLLYLTLLVVIIVLLRLLLCCYAAMLL